MKRWTSNLEKHFGETPNAQVRTPLYSDGAVSPLLNTTLDSWFILTLFKSIRDSRLYIILNNIRALYILARTATYSEVVFNRIFLYCPLTVGDRTFLKVTGVTK